MSSAEDALQTIRDASPPNGDFLDDLKERLTSPQPIPLVPFVGAGLSMPMGFPSWGAFLTQLATECGKSSEVAALLEQGKYEEAAATVEQGLSAAIFNKRVAHTFGERPSHACELKGALLELPELAAGPVVTTNFDRILERIFADAGSPFEHVVWGSQVDSIRAAIADNKPFLVKIHGDAEERTGRVLTGQEYDKHYARGNPDNLRAQLGRVFQGRTLLFLGCSLGRDRTMDVLSEVLREASGLEHFAVVEKPASDADFFARQQLLGERSILPIWYPTGRHDLIAPLLRWIASLQPSPRAAAPEVVLERPAQRKTEIRSELDLLVPYQRTTEFLGREAEFASLQSWLRSEPPVSVRVVTGSGGAGKTRLAIELLEWLEGAEPHGWNCGFLTHAEMERFSGLQNLSQWRRRKPVLAVVDYAAGSADRLRLWLEQLVAAKDSSERFRLLLLEREASFELGWLSSVVARGYSASAVRALFDPPEPVRLQVVAAAADRRALLSAAIEKGAALRGAKGPAIPAPGKDVIFDQRLDEPQWGDPLILMSAGLTALDTGLPAAMALGRTDLALQLAGRECARVARFGNGAPKGLMEHMAAYVTVSGGLASEDLQNAAKAESEATGRTHPGGWRALADAVAEALRGSDGVTPVQPDIIGEALLLQVWGGSEVRGGCEAVVRAAKARGRQVAASVARSAQDFCVGKDPRQEPLKWLDALIKVGEADVDSLLRMESELPQHTLALRERAVIVDTLLAAALGKRAEIDPGTLPEKARVLSNLGIRLSNLGRREEALAAAEEAVSIRRQLAAQRPDAFFPALALSLNNLGNRLSELGRREPALAAAEEAVFIYRQLAAQRPDAFLPELAGSLSNCGYLLSEVGGREPALAATEESVQIFRQLAAEHPDAFLPDLALALNNLGNRLSELGRHEAALAATEESVAIRRQLAAQRPDAFLPGLAMSLANLDAARSALGQHERALEASKEAVRIYRQLAAQRPDAFLFYLAGSLNNVGTTMSALGQREEALQCSEEAVVIGRQLAAERPDAFLPYLAQWLGARATILQSMRNVAAAVAAYREGVEALKPLFLRLPDAFKPLMGLLVGGYARGCDAAGVDPDIALLGDLLPLLMKDQASAAGS